MTNYNKRLDDVLSAVYLAGTENGLGRRLTDAEEIMHRKKAFINGNHVSKEAKQAILHWVADEVIGEDISLPRSIMPMHSQTVVNIEKRKQREALAKYGYKGGEK